MHLQGFYLESSETCMVITCAVVQPLILMWEWLWLEPLTFDIYSLLVWFMCSNKCRPFMQFAYSEVVFILYIHFPLIQPCLIGIQVKQKSPRFIYIYDITLLIC